MGAAMTAGCAEITKGMARCCIIAFTLVHIFKDVDLEKLEEWETAMLIECGGGRRPWPPGQ
eukprot:11461667-Alexandrium_andersonii.AAC.1